MSIKSCNHTQNSGKTVSQYWRGRFIWFCTNPYPIHICFIVSLLNSFTHLYSFLFTHITYPNSSLFLTYSSLFIHSDIHYTCLCSLLTLTHPHLYLFTQTYTLLVSVPDSLLLPKTESWCSVTCAALSSTPRELMRHTVTTTERETFLPPMKRWGELCWGEEQMR